VFPSLLPKLQAYETAQKQKWICRLFWIQLVGGMTLFVGLSGVIGVMNSFWIAYSWPPARLPVFVMGVLAGLLRREGEPVSASQKALTPEAWIGRTNVYFMSMLLLFGFVGVVENFAFDTGSAIWLQLSITWLQLQSISALTFEGSQSSSSAARLLTSKTALWLGRISYALYLVHEPLIQYIAWMLTGDLQQPNCEGQDTEDCVSVEEWLTSEERYIPMYCVPFVWVVSVAMAIVLNRAFEEPLRSRMRPRT